jgi:hypothetical protein
MKTKTMILILISALVLAPLAGCTLFETGPLEVSEITVCQSLDDYYKPVEPTDTFPAGTQVVYISVRVDNITTEDKLTTKWNYIETGEEIDSTDFYPEESDSGYIGFSLTIDEGFPSGRYNAVVYLNDEIVETVEFSVE